MTVAVIVLGICLIVSLMVIALIVHEGKVERGDLEDRVMSLSQPISLTSFKSHANPVATDVDYIDENREYELSPPPDLSEVP